jgi:hypothetical protein
MAAAIVATGIALRFAAYLRNPPLGLDEARLALNVGARSYSGLLRPLDFDQSAPLLYLWLQRAIGDLIGIHDWALRLLPLAAGIGLMVLVPRIYARVLGPSAILAATACAAFSPLLAQYSVSVKQYGVEAWLTVLVLGLGFHARDVDWSGAPARRLVVVGALLPWLMAPAGFVLAGVWACALADLRNGRQGAKRFLRHSVPGWALSLILAYLVVYRPASANPYLHRYWGSAIVGMSGEGFASRLWAIANENLWGLALGYPGPPGVHLATPGMAAVAAVLLILLVVGCVSVKRRHGWSLLMLTSVPLLAAIGASVAGVYPLGLRLTLFAMPPVQLLLFAGLERAFMGLPDIMARRAWVVAGSALAVPLAAVTLLLVLRSGASEDVRMLVKDLSTRRQGEVVYVFARSIPQWAFYTTDWKARDRRRLAFLARIASAGGPAFENAPSRSHVEQRPGAGLDYRSATGVELYGRPTGIEWTPNLGPLTHEPDPGWAESEAERVTRIEAPVWVLMSRMLGSERALLSELGGRGACATYVRELDNATLIRYMPGPPRQPEGWRSVRPQ